MRITWTFRTRSALAVIGAATTLAGLAAATGGSAAAPARTAATPACAARQLQVWFGNGRGGGTAGTSFFPIEFSNISHHACTLFGYPGVSAFGLSGRQIGPAASRDSLSHARVTLKPGASAHALLGIRDWGALCSKPASALGLKVFAPGQRSSFGIDMPLQVCAHRVTLVVGPVRGGVGVPGFTGP